jgi:hypothetical protein
MPGPRRQSQIGFDEEPLEDLDLARLLDDREGAKEEMHPYRQNYLGLDKQVKAKIAQLELNDGSYRCGSFIVKVSEVEEKTVEFERHEGKRITIKPARTSV